LLRANRPRRSILSIGDCTIYAQFGSTANSYSCCGTNNFGARDAQRVIMQQILSNMAA
jgi:hypothetical protein